MSMLFVRRHLNADFNLPQAGWWRHTFAGSVVART